MDPGYSSPRPPPHTAVSSLNICPEEACVREQDILEESREQSAERKTPATTSSVCFHLAVGQEQAIYGDRHQKRVAYRGGH